MANKRLLGKRSLLVMLATVGLSATYNICFHPVWYAAVTQRDHIGHLLGGQKQTTRAVQENPK